MAKDFAVEDSIVFAGQQKNMDRFYRQASFFCMSSRFEGLPMVLLEAQSYGLPIVAFDCDTGPAEIVVEGTGYLAKSRDTTSLANQLSRLMIMNKIQYENMCQLSKENNKNYSLDNIIKKWIFIINDSGF